MIPEREELNRCQGCTAQLQEAEVHSHPLTDCYGSDGAHWDDVAICLCEKCLTKTEKFTAVSQFVAFAKRWGGME